MFYIFFSIIVAIVALFIYAEFYIIKKFHRKFFKRHDRPEFARYITHDNISGYNYDIINFKSGQYILSGYIYGIQNTKGLVVIAHGLGGGEENYLPQIMYFVDKGWKVFTYNCTGSFNSEGKNTVGLVQSVLDLKSALLYIHNNETLKDLSIMLYGHSWGGYAVTAILNYNIKVKAIVSISGYNSANELLTNVLQTLTQNSSIAILTKLSYPFVCIFNFLIFGTNSFIRAVEGINKSNISTMIIHGKNDEFIAIEGPSLINKKHLIKNDNVIYEATENGHFDVFRTKTASEYLKELDIEYELLKNEYIGNISTYAQNKYFSKIDKSKYSELDIQLMDRINAFYLKNLFTPNS